MNRRNRWTDKQWKSKHIDTQTDGKRNTYRGTKCRCMDGKRTNVWTERQTGPEKRKTGKHTNRETQRQTERERHTETQRQKERAVQINRVTETRRDRQTKIQIIREPDRQRDINRQ